MRVRRLLLLIPTDPAIQEALDQLDSLGRKVWIFFSNYELPILSHDGCNFTHILTLRRIEPGKPLIVTPPALNLLLTKIICN